MAGITTNGYLLDVNRLKRLLSCCVIDYQITIDGVKEEHDRFRMLRNNNGTYDKIITNLTDISNNVKSGIFNISVRCNFTKTSAKKYRNIIEQFYDLFGKDKRFSFSIHSVKDWGGKGIEQINDELMNNDEEQIFMKTVFKNKNTVELSSHLSVLDRNTNACYAVGKHNYVVNADGVLYKCTSDFENDVGSLDNIHEIKKWFEYTNEIVEDEECNNCFFYGACRRLICPKALKMGVKMCPIEKNCIDELLLSIDKQRYTKNEELNIYEYIKE